jgi:hypothetical protein
MKHYQKNTNIMYRHTLLKTAIEYMGGEMQGFSFALYKIQGYSFVQYEIGFR